MCAVPISGVPECQPNPERSGSSKDLLWQVYIPVGFAAATLAASAITVGIGSLTGLFYHSMLADAALILMLMVGMIAGLVLLAILVWLVLAVGSLEATLSSLLEKGQEQSRRALVTTGIHSQRVREIIERNHNRVKAVRRGVKRLTRWVSGGVWGYSLEE